MSVIDCYSWVEDAPSAAVARQLVEHRNKTAVTELRFKEGFPDITGGYVEIKKKCSSLLSMANSGLYTFTITDLDTTACPASLILNWFSPSLSTLPLPKNLVFRVAVREIEAWLLADMHAFATYLKIAPANFPIYPESLQDPKQYLLNVIRKHGTKNFHKEMLPRRNASVGPRYNEVLIEFIQTKWSPPRAAVHAASLDRAITALARI
jgi:hypothetical protein